MVENGPSAIFDLICRELLRLGFHSAVLAAEPGPHGPHAPYRYAATSFTEPIQRATERIIGHPLGQLAIDPLAVPLLSRLLATGRVVHTAAAREAARELFGCGASALPRLARLIRLRHVVLAPLEFAGGTSAVLVVAAERLHRSDPGAIGTFALQASIALERARLVGALRAREAELEAEVERRTADLRQALAALEEADRQKDDLLATVSHELRTPLASVLGYTDLVLKEKLGPLEPKQRHCLQVAASSGRRLKEFIDELLDFSRHELTRGRPHQSAPFAATEVLRAALVALAPRCAERGLSLRARAAPGLPRALGDRERVVQVLTNLLGNAVRHCGDGGHLRLAAARAPDGRVAFSVADDGAGIPPEHLARIFDRLYQVGDAAQARLKGAGLGLGLAISKAIVEDHGGSLSVRSRVGRGTRFRFTLPAAPP
ncbi:MAG TPA: HAMP domain-containing sensor histidine kinase [Anaeromyxobacteraceae bacterium]|jgi:signal transduction histidine kinase|nr:HAMP domain-containing sensor histidine kinase [Anaeromyxobacteraceae bacterium]